MRIELDTTSVEAVRIEVRENGVVVIDVDEHHLLRRYDERQLRQSDERRRTAMAAEPVTSSSVSPPGAEE